MSRSPYYPPGVSLSYDHIKQRLEEFYLDIIALATENGEADFPEASHEIEQSLDRAEILLQDVTQSHDVSELVVLQRLRDVSEVLDNLKLYDECRLMGKLCTRPRRSLGPTID